MSDCRSGSCGDQSPEPSKEDLQIQEHLGKISHKIAVMSGKGGVGKSSVSVYIALGLAQAGFRVGLLDVDLHGPSIPGILGLDAGMRVDPNNMLLPKDAVGGLKVVSIDCLMEDRNRALIWRGPVKHGVIRQFIGEVAWGDLDFLVVDCPPGTGDVPMSMAQSIPDASAVIVTTPQEVALADVRKSIGFCKEVKMPVLGVVENMSGYVCPTCNAEAPLFGKGGGKHMAEEMGLDFLGGLPFDPRVVDAGNRGKPILAGSPEGGDSPFFAAMEQIVAGVIRKCGKKA